jgi:hypothetical protein
MGYTKRKIRGINFSFLLAAFILACWALVCAWYGWPRGFRHGSAVGFALFALAAMFFSAFPAIWARFPDKHPVNHELRRYGDLSEISQRIDKEMSGNVEILGPFRFTATMLLYDSGLEFQLIPYDQIASAELDNEAGDAAPTAIIVRTKTARRYEWFSTWTQGVFNPEQVLARIRTAARLDGPHPEDQDSSAPPMSSAV